MIIYTGIADNYRTVNVLTITLFETLMNDQITDYLLTILNELVCTFRKKNTAVSHY